MAVETISTVLVPPQCACEGADPDDLTDLETVKDELSIPLTDTSKDRFLQRAITECSKLITNYCNRTFNLEARQDQIYIQQDPYPYQVPGGVYALQLSRWPIVCDALASFTGNITSGSRLISGISNTAGITRNLLVFAPGVLPAGTKVQAVGSNQITLTQAATATVTGGAFTTGVQVTQVLGAGVTQQLSPLQDFTVDAKRGWLIRLNSFTQVSQKWEAWPTVVQYQAGYERVPPDLVNAVLRLITGRFTRRGLDPTMTEFTQPGLGTKRYWFGMAPGQNGALPPEVEAIVDHYRVPVIA